MALQDEDVKRVQVGDRLAVFDALAWRPLGDQADGGNRQFWKPATIERVYHNGWDRLADVRWEDTGVVTNGHIIGAMRLTS